VDMTPSLVQLPPFNLPTGHNRPMDPQTVYKGIDYDAHSLSALFIGMKSNFGPFTKQAGVPRDGSSPKRFLPGQRTMSASGKTRLSELVVRFWSV
jgi:hypothetical protein